MGASPEFGRCAQWESSRNFVLAIVRMNYIRRIFNGTLELGVKENTEDFIKLKRISCEFLIVIFSGNICTA